LFEVIFPQKIFQVNGQKLVPAMPNPFNKYIARKGNIYTLILGLAFVIPQIGTAQTPFTCENQFFLTLGSEAPSSLNEVLIDPQTGSVVFESINSNILLSINAAGYRSTDNFIYCIDPSTRALIRLDANGGPTILAYLPLSSSVSYFAGDVTPDGKFLVIIGTQFYANGSALATEIVRVDLESPGYPVTTVNINVLAQIFDIAFHPETDVLYGYDSFTQRLVRIDYIFGDITYPVPASHVPVVTGSLFFDAYGNLFAYGSPTAIQDQNSLYKINPATGVSTLLTRGQTATSSDGCSCPYTIELSKSVLPEIAQPCTNVEYTFTMVNSSRQIQSGVRLEDNLPSGFTFVSVAANPIGGNVLSSPGSTTFILDDFTLPPGTSEVKIIVNTGNVAAGVYKNQAILKNLPASLGNKRLSDNLETLALDDSTAITITRFSFDTVVLEMTLCSGTTSIELNAAQAVGQAQIAAQYLWNTGEVGPVIDVTIPGQYEATVVAGCDTALVVFQVSYSSIIVDVLQDLFSVNLGDSIKLQAIAINSEPSTFYQWLDPQPGSIACPGCAETTARPFNDLTYTVVASNNQGCSDSASVRVTVNKNRSVYFPNVFSPDYFADSFNNFFYGFGDEYIKVESLTVYSRWGEKMFESRNSRLNDPYSGWDGSFRNQPALPGVYIWVAQLAFLDGETATYYGDVTLIR
jgi:uncharacterized repeat protein (TIGR01451 family)